MTKTLAELETSVSELMIEVTDIAEILNSSNLPITSTSDGKKLSEALDKLKVIRDSYGAI